MGDEPDIIERWRKAIKANKRAYKKAMREFRKEMSAYTNQGRTRGDPTDV
jgi:Xaa-Pro aminopeptidase